MPRVKKTDAHSGKLLFPNLLAELVEELKAGREFGQPRIEEEEFPRTHLKKVTVIWDKWEGVPDQERVETILRAYQQADGKDARDQIALAGGLTFPEAHELGHL